MKRFLLISVITSLLTIGCMDYDEAIVLNEDGSGTIAVQYKIDRSYFDQMAMIAQQPGGKEDEDMDPTQEVLNRTDIEELLGKTQSGIKLLSYDKKQLDDTWVWDMKFAFDDINKLYFLNAAMQLDSQEDADSEGDLSEEEMKPIFTKQADGSWLFERELNGPDDEFGSMGYDGDTDAENYDSAPEYSAGDSENDTEENYETTDEGNLSEEEMDAGEMMQGMAQHMQDLEKELAKHKIRFSITMPGKVVESNATTTDGNTLTWEYKLTELSDRMPGMHAVIRK